MPEGVRMVMIRLKYGNTNTFYLPGEGGGLLFDTDYAGTLPAFFKVIKQNGIGIREIRYVLVSHFHPDHMGLVGELQEMGVKLLLLDTQVDQVRYSDPIFGRDRIPFRPVDPAAAAVISCQESREFLAGIGIRGEIIPTPSHSSDSISLLLDEGNAFVGDLEPMEYLEAYRENKALQEDWERILALHPKTIFFAHRPEKRLE